MDGFSFCIYRAEEKYIDSFLHESSSVHFESVLLKFEKDHIHFKSIHCIFVHPFYTLAPQSLFDSKNQKSLLKLSHNSWTGNHIRNDFLEPFSCHIVYGFENKLVELIQKKFPYAQFNHYITILLKQIKQKPNTENTLYIHIKNQNVDLIGLKQEALHLVNSNQFENKEELLYYVLFTLKQLKWSPDSVSSVLLGDIEPNDQNFKLLYEYIRCLTFFSHDHKWSISEKLTGIDQHKVLI